MASPSLQSSPFELVISALIYSLSPAYTKTIFSPLDPSGTATAKWSISSNRLHNYGPDVMIGSLHINVNDTMNAHEIHGLTRKISTQMYDRHGIIMTVGVYAVATGDNRRAELQTKVIQTLAAHKEIVQVHGFYYSEKDNMLSVDVVPDITEHDDDALIQRLKDEIQPLVPDMDVIIVVDHNYSE